MNNTLLSKYLELTINPSMLYYSKELYTIKVPVLYFFRGTVMLFHSSDTGTPKYLQLYEKIINDIQSGHFTAGEKLPSIRQMARELSLSRTTIENAYNQLVMEGYILNKPQSGYYVAALEDTIRSSKSPVREELLEMRPTTKGYYDPSLFEIKVWKRYLNKALNEYEEALYLPGNTTGEDLLKEQIGNYIYKYRGVICQRSQIIIGSGVQSLLQLLCHLLRGMGYERIAFEDPGFIDPHHIFSNYGFDVNHISVHKHGMDIEELKDKKVGLAYVSPSHQFPTGAVMPIANRLKLINWAQKEKALIIEDDYDSELTYKGQPVPSLQSFDKGNGVIYLGSFSTLFLPALRISYMILPYYLVERFKTMINLYNPTVSKVEQLALALYMKDGEFEKHTRRVRKIFNKKNEVLTQFVHDYMRAYIKGINASCGVYMMIECLEHVSIKELVRYGRKEGIPIHALTEFATQEKELSNTLILKYRNIPVNKLEDVVKRLVRILEKSA